MRVLHWFVLPILFCTASPAHARAAETAQAWFERGVSFSRAAQWTDARAAYLQSLQLEPRVSTYFNLATASLKLQLGRATLLALDEFSQLANPRDHAEFLAEAARMRAEAIDLTGTVILTDVAADATVQVDQEDRAWRVEPEHRLSLDPGHHVLTLRAPSYLTRSLEVDIAKGISTQLSASLRKEPVAEPPVHVSAAPARAEGVSSVQVLVWGGIAAVGLGALATALVLTLQSEPEGAPRGAGGSLDMVFD